jgi:hypothetical protein
MHGSSLIWIGTLVSNKRKRCLERLTGIRMQGWRELETDIRHTMPTDAPNNRTVVTL